MLYGLLTAGVISAYFALVAVLDRLLRGAGSTRIGNPRRHIGVQLDDRGDGLQVSSGLKIIYVPGGRDDVAVKTFATSEPNRPRRRAPASIDWVKDNTDFDEIFYRDSDHFLSSDLSMSCVARTHTSVANHTPDVPGPRTADSGSSLSRARLRPARRRVSSLPLRAAPLISAAFEFLATHNAPTRRKPLTPSVQHAAT
jgi:hypothetical protein